MAEYENLIDTNISWIPQIPKHWQLLKINSLFKERKTKVSDKDFSPLSVTKKGILPQLENAAKSNDGDNRKLVKAGDFVINSRSDRKSSCGVSSLDGSVSLINIVLSPRDEMNGMFIHYLLRNYKFSEEYYRNGRGIVADLWTTRYSEMKTILLPVPLRAEQDQIVRFLDWKVSEINKLIGIKRKKITELTELKKSVINGTVTKGLNKKAPMRFSGVDWVGDIPSHWHISKLKRVGVVRNEKGKYIANSTDKYIGLENVKSYSNEIFSSTSEYDSSVQCICRKGDLMFSKLRPYLAKAVIAPYDGFCTGEMIILSSFDGDIRFLRYIMLHEGFINSVNSSTYGAKMPRANPNYILNMNIPLPLLGEQQKIADYIDQKISDIDKAIEKHQQIIVELNDLKLSLISDVVTGKIDVRHVAIPAYEHVEDVADAGEEIAEELAEETEA